jgi:hypothetical protein
MCGRQPAMGVETGSYSSFLLIKSDPARDLYRNTPQAYFTEKQFHIPQEYFSHP